MPRIGPIRRRDLIYYFRRLGFSGPQPRGKHEVMRKGTLTLTIPNPHRGDISTGLLMRILREAGISRDDWEQL
jgi:predicted RNA binding protein YcfA (HicA-like mRNA interferase family)